MNSLRSHRWTVFVRDQLARLSEAGDFPVLVQSDDESNVLRYVIQPQADGGRAIIIPACESSLLSPLSLPPRQTRDLLAPYTIRAASEAAPVNVPWSRVLRDYKQMDEKPVSICIGCTWGTACAHGWSVPSPRSIIVLSCRDRLSSRQRIGWFVRFNDLPQELVQVPKAVVRELSKRLGCDIRMCTSSLLSKYALDFDDGLYDTDFVDEAHRCYRQVYESIKLEMKAIEYRKRKRGDERGMSTSKQALVDATDVCMVDMTCTVCLDDKASTARRCRTNTCRGINVCNECHHNSRGLCPICDRTAFNADYPCAGACGGLARLSAYGMPCITCGACNLCSACYTTYEQCGTCESETRCRLI